jgi:PleD family two-component response regulator
MILLVKDTVFADDVLFDLYNHNLFRHVSIVSDEEDAFRKISEKISEVDTVYVYLTFPYVDGLKIIRRLKALNEFNFLNIVAVTSSSEEQEMFIQGASYPKVKSLAIEPFDFDTFVYMISQTGINML